MHAGSARTPSTPFPIIRDVTIQTTTHATQDATTRKRILALAVPTFGQLVAEPAFVLIDTAIIGHVGDAALAGLSIGSTIVLTVVGLCVFLAYGTTSNVARLLGAGRRREGLEAGVAGLWLALAIGVAIALALLMFARPLCMMMGARGAVLDNAAVYVRSVACGIPGMLLVYAANGIFRGLKKIGITLFAAITGAVLNTVFDLILVVGCGMGVLGSGLGTLAAQWIMALMLVVPALVWARREDARVMPNPAAILSSAGDGLVLFVRTLALRACLVATVVLAAHMGTRVLAAYQAVNSTWNFVLNMLDSIAIAGQTLVATEIGAGRKRGAMAMTRAASHAGLLGGVIVGCGLVVCGLAAPALFTTNETIRGLITVGMVVVGMTLPLAGWMWALDGILIGAGDYRYLAATCTATAAVYLACLAGLGHLCDVWDADGHMRMAALWLAVNLLFVGLRALFNGLRARSGAWIRA